MASLSKVIIDQDLSVVRFKKMWKVMETNFWTSILNLQSTKEK
jgi:hypothetical protein